METVYKILNVLTMIFTWAVIAVVVISGAVLYGPRLFHTTPYIVLSSSMEPSIHTGSLAYITETENKPSVGDVIAYQAGEMPVVHRVVEVEEDGYLTQGDANDTPDMNIVEPEEVLGICSFVVPGAGFILSAVRSSVLKAGPIEIPTAVLYAGAVLLLLYGTQYILSRFVLED